MFIDSVPLNSWISFATVKFRLVVLHMRGKELQDDQNSDGSQPVSLGVSGAQIHKDLAMAEEV